MLRRGVKERLEDIITAIEAIQTYSTGFDRDSFLQDRKTIRAVSYEFIVMGEAVARLPTEFTAQYPELPWREISAVRNYAVHEYFRLSPDILW